MKGHRVALGILGIVLALTLMAGRTSVVGQPRWMYWTRPANLSSLDGTGDHAAVCSNQVGLFEDTVDATTSAQHACYPDPTRDFQLTRFGVTVVVALDDDVEQCELVLEADNDGTAFTGDEIASSVIQVGDLNPDTTNCNDTINAVGESCIVDLDTTDSATLVLAGGWFAVAVNDGDEAVQSCTTMQAVQLHVWGYYP